jgi:3-(3-hydroxy-phenyl)propionate hydroxylase
MDDVNGHGFLLVSREAVPGDLPDHVHAMTASGTLADWLDLRQAQAVLVRPDRYVFGTGSPQELLAALS